MIWRYVNKNELIWTGGACRASLLWRKELEAADEQTAVLQTTQSLCHKVTRKKCWTLDSFSRWGKGAWRQVETRWAPRRMWQHKHWAFSLSGSWLWSNRNTWAHFSLHLYNNGLKTDVTLLRSLCQGPLFFCDHTVIRIYLIDKSLYKSWK